MPSQLVEPLTTPIRLTFPDGTELISSIDPDTNLHSVQCDLCGKVNQLGLLKDMRNHVGGHKQSGSTMLFFTS